MPYPKHTKTRRLTGFWKVSWKVSLKLDIFEFGNGMSTPSLKSHSPPRYAPADFNLNDSLYSSSSSLFHLPRYCSCKSSAPRRPNDPLGLASKVTRSFYWPDTPPAVLAFPGERPLLSCSAYAKVLGRSCDTRALLGSFQTPKAAKGDGVRAAAISPGYTADAHFL
jgi:hypothetical protein